MGWSIGAPKEQRRGNARTGAAHRATTHTHSRGAIVSLTSCMGADSTRQDAFLFQPAPSRYRPRMYLVFPRARHRITRQKAKV